jgi:hypothetical protein
MKNDCHDESSQLQDNSHSFNQKNGGLVDRKLEQDKKLKEKLRRNGYSLQKPIDYSTGVLIQIWCRHQYLKGLLPSLMIFWFFGFYFLATNYEEDASSFFQNALKDHGCYLLSKESLLYPKECHLLEHSKEYNHLDNRGNAFLMTVSCSDSNDGEGVNLYYDTDNWGLTDNSYAFTIIVNFLFPIIVTYFIYETIILALYDCLVIVPCLDAVTEKPVVQYVDYPYRVSWFILRDIYHSFASNGLTSHALPSSKNDDSSVPLLSPPSSQSTEGVSPSDHPGIRMSSISSLFINCFLFMILFTIWNFGISSTNVYHCTDQSEYTTSSAKYSIEALLAVYLFLTLIPTFRYYYRLFFLIKDIEILACSSYSEEFYRRRHQGIRNLFDLFPVLFFPLLANVFYYPFYLVPHYLCSLIFQAVAWLRSNVTVTVVEEEKRNAQHSEGFLRRMNNYYEKNVMFNLQNRWYCSWFIRQIEVSELIGGKQLRKDGDDDDEEEEDDVDHARITEGFE